MREYRIESPYPLKNPELFRRVRECIRRRSVLGPWKKVCLERRRYQELRSPKKDAPPNDEHSVDDTTGSSTSSPSKPPTVASAPPEDPIVTQTTAEIQMLEAKLQMLQDHKHVQFGLLKTILIEEARAKARAAPPPVPVPPPVYYHHPAYPTDGGHVVAPPSMPSGGST